MADQTNQTPDNLESVMRRVQKLLAIAQDGRADPNEAAAAAAMAEKVMRKYQLEHQDILVNTLKNGDDLTTEDRVVYSNNTRGPNDAKMKQVPIWASWVAVQVAQYLDTGVRASKDKNGDACIRFYGMKQDVMVAGWMLDYLVSNIKKLCNQFKASGASTKNGDVASYRRGVALGICSSLKDAIQAKLAESDAVVQTGTSLMVVKQNAITAKYGKFEYAKKAVVHRHADAFAYGKVDGNKIDINVRGVADSSAPAGQLKIGGK